MAAAKPNSITVSEPKKNGKGEISEVPYVAAGNFFLEESLNSKTPEEDRPAKLEEARHSYAAALKLSPKNLVAHRGLAETLYVMNRIPQAITQAQVGLQAFPRDPALLMTLGQCYARERNWPLATASMKEAVRALPENKHFIRKLGYCQAFAGSVDESLATLKKAMKTGEAHFEIARVLYQQKKDEKAREHLQIALELDPTLVKAHTFLTQIQREMGPRDRGIQPATHEE